ncbi:conserved hypothetical protein [Thermotomaculum hydrothermale]|uniref:MEMO1 family protein TTHT_0904 n=1 Tax=Thermotomaculum hydrothermale TaxID=981385 RepID=A0A7R6SZ51_9BACT|nr:AmmeMemoRadiSam system protein B [Thermotomaculum hydrothermale]BBB32460.1 conserved hypothetical protein [Thermotomaculum hydrothermale]
MRRSVYAGSFYPAHGKEIVSFFNSIKCRDPKINAIGAICPHAGYIYSGKTAYKTLCSINIPETVVIFCPNHRGLGWALAISPDESWETPFGEIKVDLDLSREIASFAYAKLDGTAHLYEHSLEVQLPIIKLLNPSTKIVAVSVGLGDKDILKDFALHIYNKTKEKDVLFIASSDMSHYVPAEYAKEQDFKVIKAMEVLNVELTYNVVERNNISMCGIYPAYLMLNIAKLKGATKGEVIEYTNSGVVTGDFNEVVAYLGMIFY